MRSLTLLTALALFYGSSAEAALLIYDFDSEVLGLHGEITFDDSDSDFAAGSTVTLANGGVVDFFFERGSAYWSSNEGTSAFSLSFGAGGTSPDDIRSYGWNAVDTLAPGTTGDTLNFNTDNTTNGNHALVVNSSGTRDGTFSLSASASAVPEPASFWLLSGVAVWGLARRRRRRKSSESISSESL